MTETVSADMLARTYQESEARTETARRRVRHLILDIHFREAASDLICRCGSSFTAPDPELLAIDYARHCGRRVWASAEAQMVRRIRRRD